MQKHIIALLLFILNISFFSCKEEICLDDTVRSLNIGFYHAINTNTETDTSFYELSIQGLGSDSIIYNAAHNINSINLPLSPKIDSCTFLYAIRVIQKIDSIFIDTTGGIYDTAYVSTELDSFQIAKAIDTLFNNYSDILTITYIRTPDITHDCGVKMNYELKTISYLKDNIIDSVRFIYPEIINNEIENIKIYY